MYMHAYLHAASDDSDIDDSVLANVDDSALSEYRVVIL